jgi:hypothetical protein
LNRAATGSPPKLRLAENTDTRNMMHHPAARWVMQKALGRGGC